MNTWKPFYIYNQLDCELTKNIYARFKETKDNKQPTYQLD